MRSVTVPLYIEQDRPFVDLHLTGAEGQGRTVRCWLDTGGGAMSVREEAARELGLTWTPASGDAKYAPVVIPRARIGQFDLDLTGARVFVELDPPHDPGVKAEAFLGGHILARHHVIFDYPNRQFTIAEPGALVPQGTPVPTPCAPPMCFPRLEAEIDGEVFGLLLDTGATCSMLSTVVLHKLAEKHPHWPRTCGPSGVSNMAGDTWEVGMPLMRLPSVECGNVAFKDVLVVGRPPGNFETFMTGMMTGPVVGALAGNALKQYRVEIDYANQTTYFQHGSSVDPADTQLVGLILKAHAGGTYTISGTTRSCGYPDGTVQPGDRLLGVDGRAVAGLSRPEVIALLTGAPGQQRRLEIERGNERLAVTLPVVRLL